MQDLLAPLVQYMTGGCYMNRDSGRVFQEADFAEVQMEEVDLDLPFQYSYHVTGFGFSEKIFEVLGKTTSSMNNFSCHVGLMVDKMKVSEHLSMTTTSRLEEFVDLGPFTSAEDKHAVCDHGMVIIFVAFVGKWTEILGAFATRGNVEGSLVVKIMVEAVILAEKAGLRVGFITQPKERLETSDRRAADVGSLQTESVCVFLSPEPRFDCLEPRFVCLALEVSFSELLRPSPEIPSGVNGRRVAFLPAAPVRTVFTLNFARRRDRGARAGGNFLRSAVRYGVPAHATFVFLAATGSDRSAATGRSAKRASRHFFSLKTAADLGTEEENAPSSTRP
ncbi:hypothetical protein MTO96_007611 [Rhipicephalus appendiculatus]